MQSDRLLLAANIVLGVALAGAALSPNGFVGSRLLEEKTRRAQMVAVADIWPRLIEGHRLDDGNGPAWLVEFADYQCSYCRRFHAALDAFLKKHADVGIIYKHLPLASIHPAAMGASRAAECGARQQVFRSVHNTLYETEHWMEDQDWASVGVTAAVPDLEAFLGCIEEGDADDAIRRDLRDASELRVTSTPSLVFLDKIHTGTMSISALDSLLEADRRAPPP